MQSENLQSIIESLKEELQNKEVQLKDANERAKQLQNQLDHDVEKTSKNEVEFAKVCKDNLILKRVIAKESEEVHSVYEKCVVIIQKYQQLEAQYKELLSHLLNSEPATVSQELITKLQTENEEQKQALDTLTAKFENKKSKYHTLKGQYKQVKEELENLKSTDPELNDKAKLLEAISELKETVQTKDTEVNNLTKTVSDLKAKLEIGKYGVNEEVPKTVDDFIKQSQEKQPEVELLEAKYNEDKARRATLIEETEKSDRSSSLAARVAELEAQLKDLMAKTNYELVRNDEDKNWAFVPVNGRLQERGGVSLRSVVNGEEEDEVDPQDLPSVDVSVIQPPKPEERANLASRSEDEEEENILEETELDSEYERLLASENVANKELITKLMNEVRKLRKELRKDKRERRELVESLRQSGSILGSVPSSPKHGNAHDVNFDNNDQEQDQDQYASSNQEPEQEQEQVQNTENANNNDNNDNVVADDDVKVVTRDAPVIHVEEEEKVDDGNVMNNNNNNDDDEAEEEAEKLASLLGKPPAEDLDEANTRIQQLEDEIKHLVDKINSLQYQETQSSLNASGLGNDNTITHDFKAALKRIAKLQKKLDDHSKPPENMQNFEEEIERLKTELKESSDHAKELQDMLDSFSKTTNNGIVDVVKENQNMKKTIERKDKEIEDATRKGADILTKYNEQQETIKTLINQLKDAKAKIAELSKANSEFSIQVEELQKDLDEADADAESCKDDLAKLDEITGRLMLAETDLTTTKIKLDKSMALLKTKGGSRAIYALEVYDKIVDYQTEISGQKELLKNIETILELPEDSLLNLVDKEDQPRPDIDDENQAQTQTQPQPQQQTQSQLNNTNQEEENEVEPVNTNENEENTNENEENTNENEENTNENEENANENANENNENEENTNANEEETKENEENTNENEEGTNENENNENEENANENEENTNENENEENTNENENATENENENENNENKVETVEDRKKRLFEELKKLLLGSKSLSGNAQALMDESDSAFYKDEYQKLTKEADRMRSILAQVEEELHLSPGHLTNRQLDDELGTDENDENRKLRNGWLNDLVASQNDGLGLFAQTREIRLTPEEEEEAAEKANMLERLSAESTHHQSKIDELNADIDTLKRQIIALNNKLSIIDTDRLAALQANSILTDKCADLQRKLNQLANAESKRSNKNSAVAFSEFENDYLLAKQKAEEGEAKIERLRQQLGKAKAELRNQEDNKKQISELTQTIRDLSKEKTDLQRKIAELEILNA